MSGDNILYKIGQDIQKIKTQQQVLDVRLTKLEQYIRNLIEQPEPNDPEALAELNIIKDDVKNE